MKDNSNINLMIRIIVCILLLAIVILGAVIVNNNLIEKKDSSTKEVVNTEEKNDLIKEDSNTNNKDNNSAMNKDNDTANNKDDNSETNNKDDNPTINIENKSEIIIVEPKKDIVIEKSTNNFISNKVGKIYLADVYEYLSLRTSPSTSAPVKASIPPCTEMTVLGDAYDPMVYVRINTGLYAGYTGYVNEDYLTQKGYSLIRANSNSSYEYYYVYNTKEYLPIRAIAELNDAYEIGRLYNGQVVLVIEKTNDMFWKVKDVNSGKVGYVVESYLTK